MRSARPGALLEQEPLVLGDGQPAGHVGEGGVEPQRLRGVGRLVEVVSWRRTWSFISVTTTAVTLDTLSPGLAKLSVLRTGPTDAPDRWPVSAAKGGLRPHRLTPRTPPVG